MESKQSELKVWLYSFKIRSQKILETKTNEMVPLKVEHHDKKHKDVNIVTNNLVALSTHNLKIKDIPKNLTK